MSHIGFSHLPMSCDLGWCHSCYQEEGGEEKEGRLLVGEGLNGENYECLYIYSLCSFNVFHYRLHFV